jgi:hypothetical protein
MTRPAPYVLFAILMASIGAGSAHADCPARQDRPEAFDQRESLQNHRQMFIDLEATANGGRAFWYAIADLVDYLNSNNQNEHQHRNGSIELCIYLDDGPALSLRMNARTLYIEAVNGRTFMAQKEEDEGRYPSTVRNHHFDLSGWQILNAFFTLRNSLNETWISVNESNYLTIVATSEATRMIDVRRQITRALMGRSSVIDTGRMLEWKRRTKEGDPNVSVQAVDVTDDDDDDDE